MAINIRIITEDGLDFYSFTNANSKLRLAASSFKDKQSPDGVQNGIVTFDTINKGANQAEITAEIKEVETLLELHKRWSANPHAQQSVFIDGQAEGGTWKQSRIVGWSRVDHSSPVNDVLGDNGPQFVSTWTISRVPFWEDLSTTTFLMAAGCNLAGHDKDGATGFVADPGTTFFNKGTAPGKVVSTNLYEVDLFQSIDRFWFGFKDQEGDLVSGDYWPEISVSDNGRGVTYTVAGHSVSNTNLTDTDALDDACLNIDFNVADDYAPQFFMDGPMAEYTGDSQRYRAGKYLILLRMKLTNAATECRVNMFQNWGKDWGANTVIDTFQDVYITDDEYHFYEMGVLDYPPEGHRAEFPDWFETTMPLDYNFIGFGAERIAGTAHLRMDYIAMIPYEHFFSWKNLGAFPGTGTGTTPQGFREMFITDEGFAYGFSADQDVFDGDPSTIHKLEIELNNWNVPINPDLFYIGVGVGDAPIGTTPALPETMDDLNFRVRIIYRPQYWSFNSS